jgi:DNA-binding response OmpR family regulator
MHGLYYRPRMRLTAPGFGLILVPTLLVLSVVPERDIVTLIAVVDHDQSLLDLMRDVLGERKWNALALRDSTAAYEAILLTNPDAVVLDVRLGSGRSGWDILEQLREEPATSAIPVIIWTGDVKGLEGKREWLHAQRIPVLPKPFELEDLFRCLDEMLPNTQETGTDSSDLSA